MNRRLRTTRWHLTVVLTFVSVLFLALTGCTSAVQQARTENANATAQEGGRLRIATTRDLVPATFYQGASDAQTLIAGLVYDHLIDYPADSLEPQPKLATGWQISPDGRTVTVDLREGVTFHDGRPFTSADVEFSLKAYADPAHVGQLARTAQAITAYDTSAPHRIVLTLAHPVSNLFDLFAIAPIIDQNTAAQFFAGERYNGTGAFTFTNWTKGTKLDFSANPAYWDGKPRLDGVELQIVPDQQTQAAQLRSGQLDLVLTPSVRDADAFATTPGFEAVSATGTLVSNYLGTNVTAPGLSDVRARIAIALAVDRDRILEEVFQGHGSNANLPWPEYSPAFDSGLNRTHGTDEAAARALLAEVGPLQPIPLAYIAGDPNGERIAQIVQSDLAEVGVTVTLEPKESTLFLKDLVAGTHRGLWIAGHTFAQYNPATLTVSAYPFNSDKNSSNFVDAEYKANAEAAWKSADPTSADARAAYAALNDDLLENLFLIELVTDTRRYVATSNVHDVTWSKKNELDLSKTYLTEG